MSISQHDFELCIKKLQKLGIRQPVKNSDSNSYEDATPISKNIKNIIHEDLITKFKDINKGKIGHLFGHGASLNLITNIKKNNNDVFASVNKIYKHKILANQLDVYLAGDAYFYNNDFKRNKGFSLIKKKINSIKQVAYETKDYINQIKNNTIILLQVGERNKYHKYHGFTDEGVIQCLNDGILPIMRNQGAGVWGNIITDGFSHPSVFALLHFLIYTGCSTIYLYGHDCGGDYFYKNHTSDVYSGPLLDLWRCSVNFINKSNCSIINVNSKRLAPIFKTIYTNTIDTNKTDTKTYK